MPRDMGGMSPSNIVHFLKGIDFPATKQELIDYAEDSNAPDDIIMLLDELPDEEYQSVTDVVQGVAQVL